MPTPRPSGSKPLVVLCGSIASGKTTLGHLLAEELGLPFHPERAELNPFLGSPAKQPLQTELWFLIESLAAVRGNDQGGAIVERHPEEQTQVFAQVKAHRSWLSKEDLALLCAVSNAVRPALRQPDLLVFVRVDPTVAFERIRTRGQRGDDSIELEYLIELQQAYEDFVGNWISSPIMSIDTNESEISDPPNLNRVISEINKLI